MKLKKLKVDIDISSNLTMMLERNLSRSTFLESGRVTRSWVRRQLRPMAAVLTSCPVCGERLAVKRLHCRSCDTTIDGHFELGWLGRLSAEQLGFIETFVRCEGKLNRMERELGLSYPTLRLRLTEVIRQLGFAVGPDVGGLSEEDRHRILDDLASGRITSEDAMRALESA